MNSINVRGVKESLSDGEMKLVKGGEAFGGGSETEVGNVDLNGGPFGCSEYVGSCSGSCLLSSGKMGTCTMYLIPYSCRCQ